MTVLIAFISRPHFELATSTELFALVPAPIAKAMLAFGVVLVDIWISFLWHRGPSLRGSIICLVVVAWHVLLSAFLLRMPLLLQEGSGRSARALHESVRGCQLYRREWLMVRGR